MNLPMRDNTAFQKDEQSYFNSFNPGVSSSVFFRHRVLVNGFRSKWLSDLEERFNILCSLKQGWDGYNGRPVSWTCANFAAQLLESVYSANTVAPSLVPGSDGTLQIEWHINQYDVEIDVIAPYNVVATRFDHITGHCEEIELQGEFSTIANWVSELSLNRNHEEAVGV